MREVAEFLGRHPPFEGLDGSELERLAAEVEVEYVAPGEVIFEQGEEPMRQVWIVRSGAVELVDAGHVLDRLGEGELFGHPSMLSGLPTGFEARAGDGALCYRLPAETVVPLLAQPAGLRYLARSLLGRPRPDAAAPSLARDPARQPVGRLVHERPVVCEPDDTVRDAARRMAAAGESAALVRLGEGRFGILTDRDLRERVVADGVSADASLARAMSAPAFCVGPERSGVEVMLEMLDRGIRHVPVVSPVRGAARRAHGRRPARDRDLGPVLAAARDRRRRRRGGTRPRRRSPASGGDCPPRRARARSADQRHPRDRRSTRSPGA